MTYRVKAITAVIKVGGSERYLHRGAIVPSAATNVEHLLAVGLLEEIALLEIPEANSPKDEQQTVPRVAGGAGSDDLGGQQPPAPTGQEPPVPPAKVGPGSSAEAWRTYAKAVDVEVPDNADRAAVIAALEAADKPTE